MHSIAQQQRREMLQTLLAMGLSAAAAPAVRAEPSAGSIAPAGRSAVGKFNFQTRKVLLNSGYEMPILGLGTYALSDRECEASVKTLLEAGGRLIDTAHAYGSEAAVGRAVRRSSVPRGDIFVITKIYPSQFSHPERAIEEALKKPGSTTST